MSCDCCDTPGQSPTRVSCPACGQPGEALGTNTLRHQLKAPWQQELDHEGYYFCASQGCEVVYFNRQGTQFNSAALRQTVGQKSSAPGRLLCYCFDIHHSDLADAAAAKRCRDFVINETRHKRCACEQRNPSGRCCLRDFPKQEE